MKPLMYAGAFLWCSGLATGFAFLELIDKNPAASFSAFLGLVSFHWAIREFKKWLAEQKKGSS